jgi:signal transduction histidine kinase
MKISFKLFLGFGFTLIIILILSFTFFLQKKKIENNSFWVLHTSKVLHNSEEIQKMVSDMETGTRGFLLTGNKNFLHPYEAASKNIKGRISSLRSMIDDNNSQLRRLNKFELLLDKWHLQFVTPVISAKAGGESNRELYDYLFRERVLKGEGKMLTDSMRTMMIDFDNQEVMLQQQRSVVLQKSLDRANSLVIALAIIAFAATLVIAWLIISSINQRIGTMVNYSRRLAVENFTDKITDHSDDELSALSESLNIMAEKLELTFDNLKKTNQELDQFAYIVSHDLKAPLRAFSSVITWLEEDLGEQVSEEILQHFSTLKSRISRMEGLINGLLEYSRIGRQKFEKEQVNLNLILNELKENYLSDPKQKIYIQPGFPVVFGQKIRIRQVFQNLLDNAVKYGNSENNVIEVNWEDAGDFYHFTVKDNGPGIDKEFHEKIFVIFQTLQPRDTIESTGIGLAIVKKIVEENNGSVAVESEPGKGTSFIISWPRK